MYFPGSEEPVLKVTLLAAEGIWNISVLPFRSKFDLPPLNSVS